MGENGRKLMAVVRREYIERVRTKWFVISTVLGPIIFALFAFLPLIMAKRDSSTVAPRLIVLDATGTRLGRYVARSLSSGGSDDDSTIAELRTVEPSGERGAEDAAASEVVHRTATGYVVLDSATIRGDSARYGGRKADSNAEATRVTEAIRSGLLALSLETRGVASATVDSVMATRAPSLQTTAINDAGRSNVSPAKMILAVFVAFFLYMSILLYGQSMLSGVIEEKMSRVAEIVISSVSPDLLLAGKVIGVTAVGLTQQLIWVVGSVALIAGRSFIFGAPAVAHAQAAGMGSGDFLAAVIATPWSWVFLVLLYFLIGFLFYGALYAAVGSTVGSEQEARQAAQPVIMLIVLTAVFISPVMQNPASNAARLMSILPFSSPIIMPLRMALIDVPPLEVATSIIVLALSTVGAIWLAARIYRVGLLMYGKRPSLKELRRWIVAS